MITLRGSIIVGLFLGGGELRTGFSVMTFWFVKGCPMVIQTY
jgi:hypothetical protein